MRGHPVPLELVEQARQRYAAGERVARIADALHVAYATVLDWRKRYGWPRRRFYPETIKNQRIITLQGRPYCRRVVMQARALWGELPAYRIAFSLGVDSKTVLRWAKAYAWGPRKRERAARPPRLRPRVTAADVVQQSEARWRCGCLTVVVGLVCPTCGTKAAWAA
jgi:uncharacterized protein YjcR